MVCKNTLFYNLLVGETAYFGLLVTAKHEQRNYCSINLLYSSNKASQTTCL